MSPRTWSRLLIGPILLMSGLAFGDSPACEQARKYRGATMPILVRQLEMIKLSHGSEYCDGNEGEAGFYIKDIPSPFGHPVSLPKPAEESEVPSAPVHNPARRQSQQSGNIGSLAPVNSGWNLIYTGPVEDTNPEGPNLQVYSDGCADAGMTAKIKFLYASQKNAKEINETQELRYLNFEGDCHYDSRVYPAITPTSAPTPPKKK